MTLHDFQQLGMHERMDHLCKHSEGIACKDTSVYYAMHDFYVRIAVELPSTRIVGVTGFKEGPLFDHMLEAIEVEGMDEGC